jgi:hypothetical protein
MAQLHLNLGTTGSNSGGDSLPVILTKTESNFIELYDHVANLNNPHQVTAAQINLGAYNVIAALGYVPANGGAYNGSISTANLGNITLTLTGSVTGGATSSDGVLSVPTTLILMSSDVTNALGYIPSTPVTTTPGTYNTLVINGAGQVVSASNTSSGSGGGISNINLTLTGSVNGSASSASGTLSLATTVSLSSSDISNALGYIPSAPVNTTAGTYNKVVINNSGQVVSASNSGGSSGPLIFTNNSLSSVNSTSSGTVASASITLQPAAIYSYMLIGNYYTSSTLGGSGTGGNPNFYITDSGFVSTITNKIFSSNPYASYLGGGSGPGNGNAFALLSFTNPTSSPVVATFNVTQTASGFINANILAVPISH